jgi:iron complex transport system substrate-binding protein
MATRALVMLLAIGALLASGGWAPALPPTAMAIRACVASVISPGPYPKTIIDPLGHRIALRAPPRRIVSLALSADEILIDLVAPERIAGLTVFVDNASNSVAGALAPKSAARVTGEPEALLALAPDLVLASAYTRPEALSLVEGSDVPVIWTGSLATFDDVLGAVTMIGEAVGEPARARSLVDTTRARIDAIASRRRGRRRRVLLWDGGITYGKGTLEDEIVRIAGGDNVASGLRGAAALTEEAAIALAPEVVIVPVRGPGVERSSVRLVGADPIWSAVEAVRRGDVHGVPRAWIGSVSHHAVLAVEALAEILDGASP